jgi:hypothetical protein
MNRKNHSFCIALAGVFSMTSVAWIGVGAGYTQDKCLDSIELVKRDIQGRLGAVISEVKSMNVDEWKRGVDYMSNVKSPFNNADHIVVISLASHMGRGSITQRQGQSAENIMSSPLLTRFYAKQIIDACEPVASVKFFYWEWYQGWSLHEGSILKEDKCKSPGESMFLWGENNCL